jgi:hypothetical protein
MKKEYLMDIIDGNRPNDVRLVDTAIRERIALIDSETYEILGYAKLVDTKKITYEEYLVWHITDIFSKNKTMEYVNNMDFAKLNEPAYSYNLDDAEEADVPLIANPINENKIWIKFDMEDCTKGYSQLSLFDL